VLANLAEDAVKNTHGCDSLKGSRIHALIVLGRKAKLRRIGPIRRQSARLA
jgi:hypothetical protein